MLAFDLRAARYLRIVLRTGGFSAAAAVHHRTQQAISKAISRFEEALGVELIHRGVAQLAPTPEGRAVLRHLEKIEMELEALSADLEALRADTRPRLNVGLGLSADSCSAGRIILEQVASAEELALTVESGTSVEMLPNLARGMLDMVVALDLGGDELAHSRVERRVLGRDRFGIVLSEEGVSDLPEEPRLADLASRPWVVGRHLELLQRRVWEAMRERGLQPPRSISSSSLTFVLDAVLQHHYVTILPESMLSSSISGNRLRFLSLPECHWELPLCLYVNRHALKRPCVSRAVDALQRSLTV